MSIRAKLLIPMILGWLGLAGYFTHDTGIILAIGGLTLAATWAAIEFWVIRPVRSLDAYAAALLHETHPAELTGESSEFGVLRNALVRIHDSLTLERSRTVEARGGRQHAEQATREAEERYALAVRGANDGLWEWDLRTGTAYFSPRWKAMLGYTEDAIGADVEEWRQRIHPDDRAVALESLDAHLAGATPRYEAAQRLLHKDGRYRWVLARGAAIRNATGKPYRLVGLNTDITARKRVEEILVGLSAGLESVHDDAFFLALVKNFASVLNVERAFIAECCDDGRRRVRMIAQWNRGAFAPGVEFDLAGTPCDAVINEGRSCVYPRDVQKLFPREVGYESYIGIPILNVDNAVLGHLACFDPAPAQEEFPIQLIFGMYAVRAGLELERRHLLARSR